MRRRTMLGGLAVSPVAARAQTRPAKLALIVPGTAGSSEAPIAAFRQGMRENGLTEGVDYSLESWIADGDYGRFPALTAAALARAPAVLLVVNAASALVAQQATTEVPIVFISINDPAGAGLIAGLARPGGNTTGLATMAIDYAPKLVELVRESLPPARRLAVLTNPLNPGHRPIFATLRTAADSFGLRSELVELGSPGRLDEVLGGLATARPDALLVVADGMLAQHAERIAAWGLAGRIAVFAEQPVFVQAGGLMSYGVSRTALFRRAAWYVSRILKGAKPADLPVEQPTRFELAVNMRTAKWLDLTVPPSILARADEVIE